MSLPPYASDDTPPNTTDMQTRVRGGIPIPLVSCGIECCIRNDTTAPESSHQSSKAGTNADFISFDDSFEKALNALKLHSCMEMYMVHDSMLS